ncbi:MAG: maltooligosyltrehalose trehalohydrolase [Frankiales bacterium]|nr:maltooligosyltrehalose trehalohydrolase [Frankiales bacterium]
MTVSFRVWAPTASTVEVETVGQRHPLVRQETGWWSTAVPAARPDNDYAFVVDGGAPRPDPRSAWQPHGVNGPSRVVDHNAFTWSDEGWRGRPLAGSVVYELHVGTFSPDGTFDGVVDRLDHLVNLGVDFIELMPVNAFPGRHGWGYDGVALFAVHDPYGGPAGLKRLVDACHTRGLGVILDVVYNHLGPHANYLPEFGPYFTERHTTPWGPAVNLDAEGSDEVRAFFLDNAAQWLRDYHVDGLRLDAVHEFVDDSATHFLAELHDSVNRLSAHLGRTLFLIAESDLNDPTTILSRDAGGHGMTAQWSDDFHHALHAALTGETSGYYVDFGSLADVATALEHGFVFRGQRSTFHGRRHGAPLPPQVGGDRLLGYLQNHDQVGNRAQGERSSALMTTGLLQIGAALVLTAPFTPLLFMGEEWAASSPWLYFTDHEDPDVAEAVREGRPSEFASFGWDPDDVPDPQDLRTFERSQLDWAELEKNSHATVLAWHRALLELRREQPDLTNDAFGSVSVACDEDARWIVVRRGRLAIACNLAQERQALPLPAPATGVLLASAPGFVFSGADGEIDGESVAVFSLV